MRIASSFSDYYDGVQAYGQEQSIVYVRKTEVIERFVSPKLPGVSTHGTYCDAFEFDFFRIFFCGRVYEGYEIRKEPIAQIKRDRREFDALPERIVVYTDADLKKYVDLSYKFSGGQTTRLYRSRQWSLQETTLIPLDTFNGTEIPPDVHIKHQTPIIAICKAEDRKYYAFKDPFLKHFEFARVVDPYTAFQELSMFVGGVLPKSGPPMVEISNESKIGKQGYNKWSFRKPPSKKK